MPSVSASTMRAYEVSFFASANLATSLLKMIPNTIRGDQKSLYRQRTPRVCGTRFRPKLSSAREMGALKLKANRSCE